MLTSRAGEDAGEVTGGEDGGRGDFCGEGEELAFREGQDFTGVFGRADESTCALLKGKDKKWACGAYAAL
jgi:hypothetical protein